MSAMAFREPNEVLWRGCRPGHKGTQLVGSAAGNTTAGVVVTVAAGKTGMIEAVTFSALFAVASTVYMGVRNGSDVVQYQIYTWYPGAINTNMFDSINFSPPLELPAGWDIAVWSDNASNYGYGFAHGWEE